MPDQVPAKDDPVNDPPVHKDFGHDYREEAAVDDPKNDPAPDRKA